MFGKFYKFGETDKLARFFILIFFIELLSISSIIEAPSVRGGATGPG